MRVTGGSFGVDGYGWLGDPGSRITLIGLGSNIVLTGAKGAAGWYMNSASLLADAGHSLSGTSIHLAQLILKAYQLTVPLSNIFRIMYDFPSPRPHR